MTDAERKAVFDAAFKDNPLLPEGEDASGQRVVLNYITRSSRMRLASSATS